MTEPFFVVRDVNATLLSDLWKTSFYYNVLIAAKDNKLVMSPLKFQGCGGPTYGYKKWTHFFRLNIFKILSEYFLYILFI